MATQNQTTPIILIGIGSSGLNILEHAQRFYQDTFKEEKPKHVAFLYIETNKDNMVGITPLPNHIKRVYISLGEMDKMVQNLKKDHEYKWLPPTNLVLNAGLGAGGIRPCGKLGMYGANTDGDNNKKIIDAINSAYSIVCPPTGGGLRQKPTVLVTGSLTGGTCSGMFIDMGYLIRHLIKDVKEIFG